MITLLLLIVAFLILLDTWRLHRSRKKLISTMEEQWAARFDAEARHFLELQTQFTPHVIPMRLNSGYTHIGLPANGLTQIFIDHYRTGAYLDNANIARLRQQYIEQEKQNLGL